MVNNKTKSTGPKVAGFTTSKEPMKVTDAPMKVTDAPPTISISDRLDQILMHLSTTDSYVNQFLDKFYSEGEFNDDKAEEKQPFSILHKTVLAEHKLQLINESLRDILNRA